MRKLLAVLALACVLLSCLGASATAGPTAASSPTKVSIRSFPGGLYGYVTSTDGQDCAAGRKIVVYERLARKASRRIGSDLASAEGFMWSVKTGASGPFYARAAATKGCAEALSGTVESGTTTFQAASADTQYPLCGPYVSEGTTDICRLPQLYMKLKNESGFHPCRFGNDDGDCEGVASDAPPPWGAMINGDHPAARALWQQPQGQVRTLSLISYPTGTAQGEGAAYINGTVPGSSLADFTVTDAFAQNEFGTSNGDHFFTPDIPGQAAGEVGGPLHLDFKNGGATDGGAQLWVTGYLYLKH